MPIRRVRRTVLAMLATTAALASVGAMPAGAAVLAGDATIAPKVDTDAAGLAEAFRVTAGAAGTATTLNGYLDASSKATTVVMGLYTDGGGRPGTLVAQGTVASPRNGAWNAAAITPTALTSGTTYWIAILGTGGTLAFRDHCCGSGSPAENSSSASLTTLPATWTSGRKWNDGSASLYASDDGTVPPPPGTDPSQVGQWSPLMDWGLIGAHSILLRTGKVLVMDGWIAPNPTRLFDPATNTMTVMTNPFGIDIFCSAHVALPDGRVVIAGGHGFDGTLGIRNTTVFDPATNAWTKGPDMAFARWYPTLTELGDGRLVAVSGNITSSTWADTPEVYDPATNSWKAMSSISTSEVHEEEYPLTYLLPNGKLVVIASSTGRSFLLDPDAPSWTPVGGSSLATDNGSAVMYRPGKLLYSGGGTPLNSTSPAQATAQTIDLTAGTTPTWQPTASMNTPRYAHTLTMLPDGKVLAVGGGSNLNQSDVSHGQLSSEQWDPDTGRWTDLAPADVPRVYHSTAVLLPDGRVLVAGGGNAEGTTSPGERNAQYYSPPYLFRGARPTITSAPSAASYGDSIGVETPDAASISSASLVSLGADTHTIDMTQHFVPLSFTRDAGKLTVKLPSSASVAPPGWYMLFILDGNGVPSTARLIQVTSSATPPAVTVTAPNGGTVSGTIPLTATASDNTGIASVQFTVDGAASGPKLTAPPFTTTLDTTKLPNGTHEIGATAISGAGVSGSAQPVTVTVSNAAPAGPVVDALRSVDGRGTVSASVTTSQPGDVLVAFVGTDGPGTGGQSVTVDGGGLTWSLVKRVNAQLGATEVWTARAPSALTGAVITSTQARTGYDQSLTVVAFSGSRGIGASATASARTGAPTVSLTTTAADSVIYGAGNDYDRVVARTLGSGQEMVHQWLDTGFGDTYWVQRRTARTASAGSVATIDDTAPTNDRWNLAAVEVLPG